MKEYDLPNGLKIIWVPYREQPVVSIVLQMRWGKFHAPVGGEGLAELTAGLMLKGTRTVGTEEFSERIEQAGASLFSDVSEECAEIGCKMLCGHADAMIPLFWEMIREPALPDRELSRLKREIITAIRSETVDPLTVCGRQFSRQLYGRNHPAGRAPTIRSVKGITPDRVREFYRSFMGPLGSTLVIAGCFETAPMRERFEPLFNGWRNSAQKKVFPLAADQSRPGPSIRLIDKPDMSQASIIAGHRLPGEVDADRNTLALANYILGGGNFSSRLMRRARSKLGKTYGIASHASFLTNTGALSISTSTRTGVFGEILRLILDVYRDFTERGIEDGELDSARRYVTGSMAFQLEGIENVTEKLLWLRFYGRDNGYFEQFPGCIARLSTGDVNRAVRAHLTPERLVITVIGQRRELQELLARHGRVGHVTVKSVYT